MSGPPIKRRRTKAIGPDSAVFAKAFTHKTVTTTNRSGLSVTKDVLVPLVPPTLPERNESTSSPACPTHIQSNDYDITMDEPSFNDCDENMSSNNGKSKVSQLIMKFRNLDINVTKSQKDYLRQFVNRIPELLQASLSREGRPDIVICSLCTEENLAIWRCIDCTLSFPVCRKCMRDSHKQAPFHRIECWRNTYYRPASL